MDLYLASSSRIRLWLGLFVASQLADLLTTALSLRFGGLEANPLASGIIAGGGVAQFAILKLVAVAAVVLLIAVADRLRRRLPHEASVRTSAALALGLQLCISVQLLAAVTNIVVLGTILDAGSSLS